MLFLQETTSALCTSAVAQADVSDIVNVEDEESPQDVEQPGEDAEAERTEQCSLEPLPEVQAMSTRVEEAHASVQSPAFTRSLLRFLEEPKITLTRSSV